MLTEAKKPILPFPVNPNSLRASLLCSARCLFGLKVRWAEFKLWADAPPQI